MEEWVAIIEPTVKKALEYFSHANNIDIKVGFDANLFENSCEPNEGAQSEIQGFTCIHLPRVSTDRIAV